MKKIFLIQIILISFLFSACKTEKVKTERADAPFSWDKATIYFLLTDRFNNGDKSNDFVHPDSAKPAPLRGYMGGDIKGITQKIEEGRFLSIMSNRYSAMGTMCSQKKNR